MGNFMIIDGAPEPGVVVWTEQISVVPNTYYAFSAWVCTLDSKSWASLQFSINGTPICVCTAPSQTNTWKQFSAVWYSDDSTTATITIVDLNTEGGGNDFGLDDISFRKLDPSAGNGDAPIGAINGRFTVNGNGEQVFFSQGNLQYKASTDTWRFAENQYDYIGDANSNISSTYSNYIDLFGWGTSGYSHGAVCYQPWSTSQNPSDYYAYGSDYNLFDQTGQADWGYNAISNGGNQENIGWRTLTHEEWGYVFNTRSTSSGIRYAKANVNGVNGVILLPDDWSADYYTLNSSNNSGVSFSSNTITSTQWNFFEQHGAVFLPAAGRRFGTSVNSAGSWGDYWSSSYCNSGNAWGEDFCDSNLLTWNSYGFFSGRSVRLVFPSQGYSFGINAEPNPSEGGAVSGAGTYLEGAECTLTATASAGYYFVNWTEGGEVVSTDAVYTFIVLSDRDLVANFMMQGAVTSHWTPITGTQYNMTLSGVIVIDGVEQTVTTLEVGAFCGDECRGSMLPEFFPPTGQYVVSLTVVSNEVSGETITFRLYDHEAQQELNIQCINDITFESNAMIGTVGDWFSFAFSHEVEISAVTEPEDAGMVTGTGSYMPGTIVSLTATANAGYVFDSWTVNGEMVSTENPYTFTVTGSVALTARFILQQTNTLPQGWNWYSTYIEMNGNDGLQQLEESLGHNGLMIKTQTPYVQNYYPSLGYDYWFGPLTNVGLTNETSYLLSVSASCEATMTGALASASDHPMTILPGWNWIGYPMTVQQGLSTALVGFTPSANDLIKGQTSSATYYANYGWFPTSFTLVPGQGYMYYSGAEGNKTLTYVSPRDIYVLEPEAECAWSHDAHSYAHNLTLLAVVSIDGEEQRTCNLELGAFVGGECRGSAVLSYFEPTGRWYAMLTVSGDDGETLELAALDKCSGEIVTKGASPMTFTSDAIVGTLDRPYEARFTSAGTLQLYPNPTNRGMAFSIDLPEGETATEIVLFNTLGEPVLRETLSVKRADIRSPKVPGVYMVKVVSKSGNVYNGRLVVR